MSCIAAVVQPRYAYATHAAGHAAAVRRRLIVFRVGVFLQRYAARRMLEVRDSVARGRVRSVAALAFLVETLYLARRFCGLR